MNNFSNEEIFQYCALLKSRHRVFSKISSEAVFTGMISACTFMAILIIPTILLNGLSVITIMKCPQLKEKIAYFLIMVQSLVDLAVGFITLPLMSYVCINEAFERGDCIRHQVIVNIIMLPTAISLVTLTAMTFERYMGVLHPFKHRYLVTKKRLSVFLVCGILFIIVCNALSFLQSQLLGGFLSVYMLLFLLFAIFVYTKIYFVLKNVKHPGSVSDNVTQNFQNERKFVKDIKPVKSCFLAVACFFLCFSAVIFLLLVEPYVNDADFFWLSTWSGPIVMLNSSLNSVIYFWSRPLLRHEASKVLKKACLRQD